MTNTASIMGQALSETVIETLDSMVKCGLILNSGCPVNFTSPLAKRYLYHILFDNVRADRNPNCLLDLVLYSIRSMSSSALAQSIAFDTDFPKEAMFQHLLMNALVRNTARDTYVCPEFSRILSEAGESTTSNIKGEIDFFVDGSLKWGIELLVKGRNVTEHLKRFEPDQIYSSLDCKDYVVVDFRQSKDGKPTKVDLHQNRVTVFFKEGDYSKCSVLCGNERQNKLVLQLAN